MENFLSEVNFTSVIGVVAGIFTSVSMLPQLVKTFKQKKSEEISMVMILCLIIGIGLWVYYGIRKNDLPIIITNAFSFIVNGVLLIFHFKYKKPDMEQTYK